MVDIAVEDLVFLICTLVGGGLLLVTVVVDDILGAIVHFEVGGVPVMPLVLSFVTMFGVGGLLATQVLDVHGGRAAIVGGALGLAGLGVAYLLFGVMRPVDAGEPASAPPGAGNPDDRVD